MAASGGPSNLAASPYPVTSPYPVSVPVSSQLRPRIQSVSSRVPVSSPSCVPVSSPSPGHGNPSWIGPDWLISFVVFDRSMGDKIGGRESGADLESGSRGRPRRPPRGWAPRCRPGTARVVPGIALARGGHPSGRAGERGLLAPAARLPAVGWLRSVGSRPAADRAEPTCDARARDRKNPKPGRNRTGEAGRSAGRSYRRRGGGESQEIVLTPLLAIHQRAA